VERLFAYGFSALMLAAVLSPALRDPDDDGFPLSTYPMFSRNRGRTSRVTTALAIDAAGAERPVPPRLVGTSETMQALRILTKGVHDGPESAARLCQAIAARLAQDDDASFRSARSVVLVTQEVDAIAYLGGDRTPLSRTQNARCAVPRSRP
jgi:hypothetical protein